MSEILKIESLSKSYGSIKAINKLALSIEKGTVYGILGPNGSGKTTTLSIIMGILKADHGSFNWFGQEASAQTYTRIGSIIETPNFYPYLSLEKNLEIIAKLKGTDINETDRVLKKTGLLDRKKSAFLTLSLGMKQRLSLAAALIGNPEVLVLDEPTNGLDPEGIADVRKIITAEAETGKTIILASHILDEVEKVCSHVAILKKGKLISSGKVNELLNKDDLVILSTKKADELYEALVREGYTKSIEKEGDELRITLVKGKSPGDINSFAFSKGIIIDSIETVKQSLEDQFLELVK